VVTWDDEFSNDGLSPFLLG